MKLSRIREHSKVTNVSTYAWNPYFPLGQEFNNVSIDLRSENIRLAYSSRYRSERFTGTFSCVETVEKCIRIAAKKRLLGGLTRRVGVETSRLFQELSSSFERRKSMEHEHGMNRTSDRIIVQPSTCTLRDHRNI